MVMTYAKTETVIPASVTDQERPRTVSYLTVGQFIGFLKGGGGSGGGHFLLEVQSDVAQFLLDVTNDFTLSCLTPKNKRKREFPFPIEEQSSFHTSGGEAVATLGQDLHQVVSQVATSQIQTEDGVGQSVT